MIAPNPDAESDDPEDRSVFARRVTDIASLALFAFTSRGDLAALQIRAELLPTVLPDGLVDFRVGLYGETRRICFDPTCPCVPFNEPFARFRLRGVNANNGWLIALYSISYSNVPAFLAAAAKGGAA